MSWDLAGPAQISQMGQLSYSRRGQQQTRATHRSGSAQIAEMDRLQSAPIAQAGMPTAVLAPALFAGASALIDRYVFPDAGVFQQPQQQGQDLQINGSHGVPFGGPGLKEPGGKYLLKEWHIRMDSKDGDFDLQYYLTMNDRGTKRIFMYNQRTKAWKSWPMPRLAVIGKNMPRHQMITRLRRNLKRHTADAVTILKLTAPSKLESTKRPGGKYVRSKRYHYKD